MKSKSNLEILPPPPPVPGGELEEPELKLEEKPKPSFFQRILKPRETKPEVSEEAQAFKDLLAELDDDFESEKTGKSVEIKAPAKKKLSKKELKQLRKARLQEKKQAKVKAKKPELFDIDELEKELKAAELPEELKELDKDTVLPDELKEIDKDIELPETLEDLDINLELKQETKKPEIEEAKDEIKSAIEKIKATEKKPSLFKRLFTKKVQEQKKEEKLMPELPETDDFSRIKNSINRARQALMSFDLEAAKNNYLEALKIYNSLKAEDQAKIYQELQELYLERKSAEELKV